MTDRTRALLGVGLIIVGLFYNKISDFIVIPEPEPDVTIIEIDKPSQEIINVTKPVADLIMDKEDRLKLCIFNKIFAERVVGYFDIKAQQTNDLYVQAATNYFGTTLRGKYDGYANGLTGLFKEVIGTQAHTLSDEEKSELSETFIGFAWCLNN